MDERSSPPSPQAPLAYWLAGLAIWLLVLANAWWGPVQDLAENSGRPPGAPAEGAAAFARPCVTSPGPK